MPNSLALLQQAFPEREQRSRAVGGWGAIGSIALAAGPVLGGLLVAHLGWRSIFLINLPLGLIGICLTLRCVAPHAGRRQRRLDWGGQVAAMLALALTEAAPLGWSHGLVRGSLLLAGAATLGLLWIEARSRAPMLPLALFRIPTFTIASIAGVVLNFAYYGLIFLFSLFFQIQQQLAPLSTGLAFLPMTAVLMVFNVLAGRLITRLGARCLMILGLLLVASGTALLVPTLTNATLSSVDASRAGIAAGVLNTARQVGGMLGVAVFGYLVRDIAPAAFMHGMHLSTAMAAALLLAASALCWPGIRPERARA